MNPHPNIYSAFRSFCLSKNGVAAIEFAIVMPMLVFIFLGMVELTTAVSYDRRVSKAGAAIADLIARSDDVTDGMDDINKAIEHQMTPFEDVDIDIKIGMVLIRNGRPQVVWSWENGKSAPPWPQGSEPDGVSFTSTMLINGRYYVVSTSRFEYKFILGSALSSLYQMVSEDHDSGKFLSLPLSDSFVLLPRRVSCVEYNDHCATWPPL
ncbi:TadE-like protein [Pseudovibrio denitrificans]|uniref:TadE-like protein n=1 Tax=Pseudovibrio denitrificans TaxID=258256 RepID=A0A1I7CPA7_9HYPH|nr:TadE/TadG family type IV pilus assembly protein [Pseudovibrio denitrificans]SFU01251.1 TadE-like protein [Pseudovibrio denitrificans]